MTHRNARLTPVTRAELVEQVLSGWPQAEVARLFRVSRVTVTKWVRRFREGGPDALLDRSSRPLRSPRQTDQLQEAAICAARRMLAWGPHRIGWRLGIARSTVYAVLRRAGLHRLAWLHRTTREIVRYEHARPGALVHLDIKKLGRIPQGGGKRILPGFAETHSGPQRGPRLGFDFLHVAVDDHSRYAYVEALPDERGPTAAAFLVRALAHFERQSIAVERILTDNGACYVSRIFTDTAAARNIRLKRTRPFRPQTNGKAEAFNKIMQAEWAYQRPYYSNDERLNVLPGFLAYYNHRRPHGGIGGATPASRLSTTSLGTTASGRRRGSAFCSIQEWQTFNLRSFPLIPLVDGGDGAGDARFVGLRSLLERRAAGDLRFTLILTWIPAFAGMTGTGGRDPRFVPNTGTDGGVNPGPFGPVWPRLLLAARLKTGPPWPRSALRSLVRTGPA